MNPTPQPPGWGQQGVAPQPPPQKKNVSSCLVTFLVLMGVGLVVVVAGGIWVYKEFSTMFGGLGDVAGMMVKASNAPGTAEMRAKGCTQAFVIDPNEMTKVAQRVEEEAAKREGRKAKALPAKDTEVILVCKAEPGLAPTCDTLAKTYVAAAHPKGSFLTAVSTSGGKKAECTEAFDASGKSLGARSGFQMPTQFPSP